MNAAKRHYVPGAPLSCVIAHMVRLPQSPSSSVVRTHWVVLMPPGDIKLTQTANGTSRQNADIVATFKANADVHLYGILRVFYA